MNVFPLRPPIGFIVEGHGEHNCYPSLFCRIAECNHHVPVINASGFGNIYKHIGEHLTDLFITHKPKNVIITVDLEDLTKSGCCQNCGEFINHINLKINEWKENAKSDARLQPLPEYISCIVQIRKFETWLISDVSGLRNGNLLRKDHENIPDAEKIENPSKWLKEHLVNGGNVKIPRVAKEIVTSLNVNRMKENCRSFDKFFRECSKMHQDWISDL